MVEINIKVDVPEGLRADFEIALAKVVEQFLDNLKISALQSRLESDEEKELIDWSVKLGRGAKKDSFKKILLKISPKTKEELLGSMSPKERRKYE
ncbi:MAG: hypothetical protein KJ905_02900 [Nanoarchaeota archaeon]|nr:hypothetical protein [Nanoarchaeota archaeon]MBU1252555.1 hypothetical protein [Nanoarchaeota archaeon]MBU1501698.1 hypothetical protein [Nanoarchaeota archaeon]MBU2459030.1 hypothetical protein [Nanoarchaeota archaeon]